ncbi:MAG: manganese efflux pump [Nitrososphaerota archaeon]
MSLLSLLIALGLAMDCFSAAVGLSVFCRRSDYSSGFRVASSFGFFQSAMLVVGWVGGGVLADFVSEVDHWVAFIMLSVAGLHMIFESGRFMEGQVFVLSFSMLLWLSVATSIDALAVGIGVPFMGIDVLQVSVYAGVSAFVFTLAGHWLGARIGRLAGRWAEAMGGAMLILLGIKILLDHLYV